MPTRTRRATLLQRLRARFAISVMALRVAMADAVAVAQGR
jgi:hypothetical protein